MALKQEAEQVRDLCARIIFAEDQKARIVASGGVIYLDEGKELSVTLTNQQKQGALAVQQSWIDSAKSIVAGW